MTTKTSGQEALIDNVAKELAPLLKAVYDITKSKKEVCDEIDATVSHIVSLIHSREDAVRREVVDENTSDGYHTFKELYEFRKLYNATLFNEWARQGKYQVHKSYRHGDGLLAFGGGWFVVMATLPSGQISNHYELKDWDLFVCEEREKADQWDGHTPQDVLTRLESHTAINEN
jgi:hypothetical protein